MSEWGIEAGEVGGWEPPRRLSGVAAGSAGSGVHSGADTEDGGVRKPVTGEACTGDADADGRADNERCEAGGASVAMSPKAASRAGVGRLSARLRGWTGAMDGVF